LSPFETKYKHVLSDYINLHPLRNRSDSAPYPASEKIRIRNRICVISTPLHIRQKKYGCGCGKGIIRSDPIRFHPYVRLTCQDLEGGPSTPSKCFPVTLQGQVKTLGRLDAIPATVDCRRPPPRVQPHVEHCGNSSGVVRRARTGRHHACHCVLYGSSSATPSSPPEDIMANHCAPTLEATTVRVQDTP
jgi:hypothetical protein